MGLVEILELPSCFLCLCAHLKVNHMSILIVLLLFISISNLYKIPFRKKHHNVNTVIKNGKYNSLLGDCRKVILIDINASTSVTLLTF